MSPFSADMKRRLRRYVTLAQPFGPADAAQIKEPECAAALFDWDNRAFADLLRGSHVIIGRRGSGKSSLLGSFSGRRFLQSELAGAEGREYRDKHRISAKTLQSIPDYVVEVSTPLHVFELEKRFRSDGGIPPVEIITKHWHRRIWWLVGKMVIRRPGEAALLPPAVRQYLQQEDDSDERSLAPDEYSTQLADYLESKGQRCVVTFDNLEDHRFEDFQNAVLAGLVAATGEMIGAGCPSLDVKLCLPAEHFEKLKSAIIRADKDLHRRQYLRWSAAELMHLSARRLRTYLALYDEDGYDLVKDLTLTDRRSLKQFWARYLPETLRNSKGSEEDTFTYLLRHTQLLPRQLLTILTQIAAESRRTEEQLFAEPLAETAIVNGIKESEDSNMGAVLGMYQRSYPFIRPMFMDVVPRLPRVFSYGHLQRVFHSSGRPHMPTATFSDFWRLMLSTGAIGHHEAEYDTDLYHQARFEYNSNYSLSISDKDTLCVHPMFSRIYNVESKVGMKVILPRGSDFRQDTEQ